MLYCGVESQDTARKLGEFLYKNVLLRGRAAWFKNTWRIAAFTIDDVALVKENNLSKAILAVRQAGGNDWDKIGDIESYLEEVSGSR